MGKSVLFQLLAASLLSLGLSYAQAPGHHAAAERTAQLDHMHHAMMSHQSHREALHMHRMGMFDERMAMGVERLGSLASPVYARRGEVLAIGLTPSSLTALADEGWSQKSHRSFDALGLSVDVLEVPKRMSLRRGLKRIARFDDNAVIAPNALYMRSGPSKVGPITPLTEPMPTADSVIGLIDTGADAGAISGLRVPSIEQQCFAEEGQLAAQDHGTVVATIAARAGAEKVVIADVFCGERGVAEAEAIVAAINWLVGQRVEVVNISLAGPANAIVEAALASATAKGHLFVASVGNDGNHRQPRYPAAYTDVVAVTAVDEDFALYRRANTGAAVDVAALGVNVARAQNGKALSGTSFAAPVVATYLAGRTGGIPMTPDAARILIAETAIDVGEPGHDPMYGAGVLLVSDRSRVATLIRDK